MRYRNNKKILIINTITIFLCMFLFSNIYKLLPNFLTATLFPVNESLFEHMKLMFISEIIVSLIVYLAFKFKGIKFNNYFLGLLVSTIFTIILFFLIYLPIYNRFGEGLVYTMIIYLIVLSIGNYIFYLIISKMKDNVFFNYVSLILISIIWIVLIYFTFNPRYTDFFFDTIDEIYGIPKQ